MEAMLSEFDYFTQQPIQTSVTDDYYVTVNPITNITDRNSVQLEWKSEEATAVSLKDSKLVVKAKLVKSTDGTANADAALVAPVNNFLNSLFESVDLEINNKQVTESNKLYPYRSFFETFLSFSEDTINKRGVLEGWCPDTPGKHDNTVIDQGTNAGWIERQKWGNESKLMTFIGRPHLDLFHQERCIPPGCSLKLTLIPSKPEFVIMCAADGAFKLQVVSVKLMLRVKKLSAGLALAQEKMLLHDNFKFPLTRVAMTKHTVKSAVSAEEITGMFTGPIPSRVVLGFVDQAAVIGAKASNPYKFENLGITDIYMTVNGDMVPRNGLKLDFATGDHEEGYISLLEAMDMDIADRGLLMTPDQWANGYTLFAFRLCPEPLSTGVWSVPKSGSVSLSIKFAANLTKTYDLIVLAEYPALMEIDRFKNVIL